jgi:hypothetical protein
VHCLVYMVRPALLLRATAETAQAMQVQQQPWTEHFQTVLYRGCFGMSIALIVAMAVVLLVYRKSFQENQPQLGPVLVQ